MPHVQRIQFQSRKANLWKHRGCFEWNPDLSWKFWKKEGESRCENQVNWNRFLWVLKNVVEISNISIFHIFKKKVVFRWNDIVQGKLLFSNFNIWFWSVDCLIFATCYCSSCYYFFATKSDFWPSVLVWLSLKL